MDNINSKKTIRKISTNSPIANTVTCHHLSFTYPEFEGGSGISRSRYGVLERVGADSAGTGMADDSTILEGSTVRERRRVPSTPPCDHRHIAIVFQRYRVVRIAASINGIAGTARFLRHGRSCRQSCFDDHGLIDQRLFSPCFTGDDERL